MREIRELNGWRAVSILLVLAAHLLPLGPKSLQLNETAGITGMALFFVLSGFLITCFLLNDHNLKKFIIRRCARIIPLAWLYLLIVFLIIPAAIATIAGHFFFYANLIPNLTDVASHFWSLCVEMQFYLWIALSVYFFKNRAFYLIPIACLAVTFNSVYNGVLVNIQTQYRVDEILAGCILALIYNKEYGTSVVNIIKKINPLIVLPLVIFSSMPQSDWFNFFRPYLAALLVGTTIINSEWKLNALLKNRVFDYLATISFALYVIHGGLRHTWLGQGETIEKYIKRPILFALTFWLAHISTYKFELPINNWARKFGSNKQR
ncbi:acyltransferase family protein [Pseudoalteromonas sp.]|uniref:acyltransferase family protein n=1 Tax=Pseudoalteromonas sp. TaxID=53249 RepID=UPI0035651BD7